MCKVQTACQDNVRSRTEDLKRSVAEGSPRTVFSASTLDPLQITVNLFRNILESYNVFPAFLSVASSFGDAPRAGESSDNHLTMSEVANTRTRRFHEPHHTANRLICPVTGEISYLCRYFERHGRQNASDPWSDRHTGVYHSSSPEFDLFILLQPTPSGKSELEWRLLELEDATPASLSVLEAICNEPMRMHTLIFSTYFESWRPYLRDLGNAFTREVSHDCDVSCWSVLTEVE